MIAPERAPAEPAGVSIARQPVFDRQRRLWGYDLFCVGSTADTPSGLPGDRDVPVNLAASAGVGLQRILAREKHVLVNLTEKDILDELAYALPSARTTVLVGEGTSRTPAVTERLERLKADGFQVAVRDFTGMPECETLYRLASILEVKVSNRTSSELAATVAIARTHATTLLASHVPDLASFATCQALGFDLFEGAFSKAPEIVPMRKISSNQVARFNVFKVLDSADQDLRALAKAIETDATISFRLLTHVNSVAFGFSQKIASISHAVTLLGWRQVANWLRVVLLSDISQGAEASELLLIAAQRAKFLELIAERYPFWGFKPESMHLLGLFSLLDTMIGVSMEEVVSYLPLDGKLKAALCRAPKSEYLPLLTLTQCLEEARWAEAETMIQQLNLDSAGTRATFQEAVTWAAELASMIECA
jgi:c-di-GMP phosphodiesterase